MAQPHCLLFDCDGTLVDSEPLLAAEMTTVLNELGLPFTPDDYIGEFRGARFSHITQALQHRYGEVDPERLKALEADMRQRFATRVSEELTTLPGVREALDLLAAYPSGVVSNGAEAKIRASLTATGLSEYFDERLFSGYSAKCWKPDPCLYLYAARLMGFAPEQCLAIDDAIVGVQAALAAGMTVVHLNRFPDVENTPAGAISISNMHQLPTIVAHLSRSIAVNG